ncbi:MAG: hypothetical protein GIW95_05010 [Candidatus Eremiobacteraeota bacterium]|nr:hypothetical protein [Candidatus Eremiobacteraeota bacterium]
MTARDLAFAVLRDVFGSEKRGAQASFDLHARRSELDARDRAFAAELAYGTIKMRRLLDWYLAPYLGGREKPLPPAIGEILRLGAYQMLCGTGVDQHAAVYETVNLASRHGHRGTAGLVNAVLRRIGRDAPAAPDPTDFDGGDDYTATAHSLPTWIVAGWTRVFGERRDVIVAGVNGAPQRAVRVNRLKASVEEVRRELETAGAVLETSPYVEESLILRDGLTGDDANGRWAMHSESAAMPVDILDPKPGESIIEFCAGRGNKSVQIAARMANEGTLYSVEIDSRKVAHWRHAIEGAGVSCATIVHGDARTVELPQAAAALVDAPCSGIGIVGRHPEARWRKAPSDGERLAPLQSELLDAAAERLAPHGRLVYSVCSSDPREGPDVIGAFLERCPEFFRSALPERYAPFARNGDILVPPGIDGRDGFYIASLARAP